MHTLLFVGVAVGLFGGVYLGYMWANRLVERIATLGRGNLIRACASGAGLLALLPAGFLAFIIGGNFGGAWAVRLFGQWTAGLGIALGVGLILAVLLCGAGVVGALIGVVVSRTVGGQHAA